MKRIIGSIVVGFWAVLGSVEAEEYYKPTELNPFEGKPILRGVDAKKDPLHFAVMAGNVSKVKEIIEKSPEMLFKLNEVGIPALLYAVYFQKKEIVSLLVANLTPEQIVCQKKDDVYTAISLAIRNTDIFEIVTKSLNANQIGPLRIEGKSLLHLAVEQENSQIVSILIQRAPQLVGVVCRGQLPIHVSAVMGGFEIFTKLYEAGPGVIAAKAGAGEYTVFHLAAMAGDLPIIIKLLGIRPDLSKVLSKKGMKPFDYASVICESVVSPVLSSIYLPGLNNILNKYGIDLEMIKSKLPAYREICKLLK